MLSIKKTKEGQRIKHVVGEEREKKKADKGERRGNSLIFLSLFLIFSSPLNKIDTLKELKEHRKIKNVCLGMEWRLDCFYPTLI